MRVGVAGLGFMGAMHLQAWRGISDVTVAAVMSTDARKLSGDLSGIGGNLEGAATTFDFSAVAKYASLEEMLADTTLDIIDICLPTHLHAESAVAAIDAGRHVFLEKPLALDGDTADRVVARAAAGGKTFMVGQVLRFIPEYQALAREVRQQGPARSSFFRRRCAAPAWSKWLIDPAKSGGALVDLLIHDLDYCISLWGMPEAVRASGHRDLSRGIDILHAELQYSGSGSVLVTGGWHHKQAYPFAMEFTVVTDAATYDWKHGGVMKRYTEAGLAEDVAVESSDPFAAELGYFAECVRSGSEPLLCQPAESAQAIRLAEWIEKECRR